MERLDRERHVGGAGVGQHRGDAVLHLLAGVHDVLRRARQTAHHEDQAVGAERRGFVDGLAVVVDAPPVGPAAVSAGNMPPRQRPVTRRLLLWTIRAASSSPTAATWSRHGEIAVTPCLKHPSTISPKLQPVRSVARFIERMRSGTTTSADCPTPSSALRATFSHKGRRSATEPSDNPSQSGIPSPLCGRRWIGRRPDG